MTINVERLALIVKKIENKLYHESVNRSYKIYSRLTPQHESGSNFWFEKR